MGTMQILWEQSLLAKNDDPEFRQVQKKRPTWTLFFERDSITSG